MWRALLDRIEDRVTGKGRAARVIASLFESPRSPMLEGDAETSLEPGELLLGSTASGDHPVVLPAEVRDVGIYVVGSSGTGKSSFLLSLFEQDVQSGKGAILLDPHSDLAQAALSVAQCRSSEVTYLDLADQEHLVTWNPLTLRPGVIISEQVARIVQAVKRIWGDESWGPRLEQILRCSLAILIENQLTLHELRRLLMDADFRMRLVENSLQLEARQFFVTSYDRWNAKEQALASESTLNKVGAFLADERIGLRLSQPQAALDIQQVVDSRGILIVSLAKGQLLGNADLMGALLLADVEMAILSRPPSQRHPIALYLDEFAAYSSRRSLTTLLAEGRKFNVNLLLAHQTLSQLDEELLGAVLGNARTQICFRISRMDAEVLAKEFYDLAGVLADHLSNPFVLRKDVPSLQELREGTFSSLTTLPQRHAYLLVRTMTPQPILFCTYDAPPIREILEPPNADSPSMPCLRHALLQREAELESQLADEAPKKRKTKTSGRLSLLGDSTSSK